MNTKLIVALLVIAMVMYSCKAKECYFCESNTDVCLNGEKDKLAIVFCGNRECIEFSDTTSEDIHVGFRGCTEEFVSCENKDHCKKCNETLCNSNKIV